MKRICSVLLTLCLLFGLGACGQKGPTWEEQYDLGVKYLSEGNYQEAIIAFTAAIEIDPKRAEAFVGRGDAYVGTVDLSAAAAELPEESRGACESALADYLEAIGLDNLLAAVYGKAADIYLALGDEDSAIAILEQGYEATGDAELLARRQALGVAGSDEVVWTDPVFEQLVRAALGLPDGPVYVRDLDAVECLDIYGDQFTFVNEDDDGMGYRYVYGTTGDGELFAYYGVERDGEDGQEFTQRGGITNVDALRYFRNLSSVMILANHVTDISVLREMKQLNHACFWANDIADLSPLEELPGYYADEPEEQFVEIGDILEI